MTTPAPGVATVRADTPQTLSALVDACLAKDPKVRPDAATLAEGLRGGGVIAVPTRRGTLGLAAAAVVLVALGSWLVLGRGGSGAMSIGGEAPQIAVMPLSAISDTSLTRLGQDLVVTLSTTLDGVGELRSTDAATLLLNTRDAPSPLPLEQAQAIAARLGAGSVLMGTLIGEGDQVRASVTLYGLTSDTAIAPVENIAALTDSLTLQLLREVWRGSTPPSPVLAGLTTASFEALRHFLDGEQFFQRLDIDAAIAEYRRAFELDSTFVQAYLRYNAARTWNLQGTEPEVVERLQALADKLPERERLWLEATRQTGPLPERQVRWRKLTARYPDYPPVLMEGVDNVIHYSPMHGIALGTTLHQLERSVKLTPDNADAWLHLAYVQDLLGESDEAAGSYTRGAGVASGFNRIWMTYLATYNRSIRHPDPAALERDGLAMARAVADLPAGSPFTIFSGMFAIGNAPTPERLALAGRAQREFYSGEILANSDFGEGVLQIARGDWEAGLAALERLDGAGMSWQTLASGARFAVIGAWLGAVDPAVAAAAVARARTMPGANEGATNQAELLWFDGILAIVNGDASALGSATTALRALGNPVAAHAASSLRAQRLVKSGAAGAADSVRAVADAAMRDGGFLTSAAVVNRFVIARALRSRGGPDAVERYLMWIDVLANATRDGGLRTALAPLVEFERGMALEEAGNHDAAVLQLSRFVAARDRPSDAERQMLAEALRVIGGGIGTDNAAQVRLRP